MGTHPERGRRQSQCAGSVAVAAILATVAACAAPVKPDAAMAASAPAPALQLHRRLLVLDTHLDTPANFSVPGWDIMDRHRYQDDGSQVDEPRMAEGGVDGGFFAIYIGQGPRTAQGNADARDAALVRAMEIREMLARHGEHFELALKPDDAARIKAAGRHVVYMSMENGYPFEADLSLMRTFYRLGVRMMGPAHFLNNDLADSATDPKGAEWGGLSPLGRQFIAEANRLGVVLDASHSSDAVLDQMLQLSKAPVILSHSGCKAIFNHPRNIDDARLRALAAHGGVIQVNAFSAYMVEIPKIPAREAAVAELHRRYGASKDPAAARADYIATMKDIDQRYPVPRATLDDYMQHLLHAIAIAGIDHVGISADFDGGGGVDGLDDVSSFPKITARLLAAGYSETEIAKIWGGNALRVLREVQALREPGAEDRVYPASPAAASVAPAH